MAPSAIAVTPEPQYVEFSHDGSWGHRREVLTGARAKPTFDKLPIVDMAGAFSPDLQERTRVAQAIATACQDVGFFYVVNHGIPDELVEATFNAAKDYFARPLEEKMQDHIYRSRDNRGYEPVHGAKVDPRTAGDRKESFLHNYEPACEEPPPLLTPEQTALLHQNLWPARDAGFRAACHAYDRRMVVLLRRMMQLFALGLGLDEHYFDASVTHPLASCKMIHYPPPPDDVVSSANDTGIGAHTDFVCFTMLAQDAVGGLEVLNANAQWVAAPPVAGSFVVNVGDFLMRLTNKTFLSTVHRVANTAGRERYSMPWFCSFNLDATVEVLPQYAAVGGGAAYAPCTVAEYYRGRLAKQREEAKARRVG